jgi:putative component of toxin-antitoxin plasmid stabilization module
MIELILLFAFDTWFHGLRDRVTRKQISARLARLATARRRCQADR